MVLIPEYRGVEAAQKRRKIPVYGWRRFVFPLLWCLASGIIFIVPEITGQTFFAILLVVPIYGAGFVFFSIGAFLSVRLTVHSWQDGCTLPEIAISAIPLFVHLGLILFFFRCR